MRTLAALTAVMTLAAAAAQGQRGLDLKLGLVKPFGKGRVCILTHNTKLKDGQRIFVVSFDEWDHPRQEILRGVVSKEEISGCDDLGGEIPAHSYELSLKSGDGPLGIGVLSGTTPKRYGRFVRADVNGDGKLDRFRICWSSEGAHLTVWSGVPLKSKRLWHTYYYAGYDTEPNCTKKDYD